MGLLFLSGMPLVHASFSDVLTTDEHYAAVTWWEERAVIQGYEDGTFRPDQPINRAEALKIVLEAHDVTLGWEETVSYPDVATEDWFYNYVMTASSSLGWVQGYPDGTFRPDQTINLAEALKIIAQAEALSVDPLTEAPYSDVPTDAWFAGYVQYFKDRFFIEAQGDGLLHPEAELTRGEFAELLYRFSYVSENGLTTFPLDLNWPMVQHAGEDIAFKVPFGWTVIQGDGGEVILWLPDTVNGQKNWTRTYPNSAVVTIVVDPNTTGLSAAEYFEEVQIALFQVYDGPSEGTTSLSVGQSTEDENILDLYLALSDGTFAVIQANYGTGALEEQLGEIVRRVEESVVYSVAEETSSTEELTAEAILEQARSAIQVDGQGQTTLALFSDLELIETDTLGVGTGPVDYYYSPSVNVTLKYERSFDVILDIEEGQTSAF